VYSGSSSSSEMQIDLSHFGSGIYFIKVIDKEHHMSVRKIVLQ